MRIPLFTLCNRLGIPPRVWMIENPLKIHEWRVLTKDSGLRRTDHILDLGCGKGHWTLNLARHCDSAIGIDTSPGQIAFAERFRMRGGMRDRVRFICGKLEDQHLPATSLDRVFSFCVLEHIPNLDVVLKEVLRLLKPGGELHVSVDSLGTLKNAEIIEKHRKDNCVHQYFTPKSLEQQLQAAGFEVKRIFPILTGTFAREQFETRIERSYKQGFWRRHETRRRFAEEDNQNPNAGEGIMLIARARRPA